MRAAALLRIARVESAGDGTHARLTLLETLEQVRQLPSPEREYLLEESREVAAAVAPELLAEIPIVPSGRPTQFASGSIVDIMLQHGHLNAAFDYLLHYNDPASFPFHFVANVLHELGTHIHENAARRTLLLRRTVDAWRTCPPTLHHHERHHFIRIFGHFWQELPADQTLTIAHEIVENALQEADNGISAGYMNEIHFSSPRQHHLFEILHVLRRLDPALAQSLIEAHAQLAVAARRFPDGLETMREEAAAEHQRRKASGAICEGGYVFAGDPKDFDRQRSLIESTRRGEYGPSMEDALEKYRQDTSSDSPNYAPKESWPSTGRFRSTLYSAGKRLGTAAAELLDQIPDSDLRLFATIELAAALAGVPEPHITQRRQPTTPESLRKRITDFQPSTGVRNGATDRPTMRSPDGRLIRCPKCLFRPTIDLRWGCQCDHIWNTFLTSGRCPACQFQCEVTRCPQCGEISPHRAWYANDSASPDKEG